MLGYWDIIAICSIPFWLLIVLYYWERQKEKEERLKKLEEKIEELEEKRKRKINACLFT